MCHAGNIDPISSNGTTFLRDVQLTLQDPNSPECQGAPNNTLLDGTGFCTLGAFPTPQEVQTLPDPYANNRKDACNGDSGGRSLLYKANQSARI